MIREEYSFYGPIQEAIYCRDSEVILSGPADTGKTLGLLWKLNAIAEQRKASIVIARKQLTDVFSTVLQTFQNKILGEDRATWPCAVYGGEKPQWYDYRTGTRIWVAGLDKSSKVLSAEHDIIYINQAEEVSLTDWETCTTRTTGRAGNLPYGQTIGDCNPGPPTHWIRSRAKSGTLTLFESGHKDNPSLYDQATGELLPGGVQRIEALKNLTGSRLMRLYHGLWAAPEGAIYDVFDEDKHVVASFDPPPLWPRAVGIDPFGAYIAAVWVALDPQARIANVYREYREPFGLTVAGHVENILKLSKGETVFVWVCGAKSERAWRLEFQAAGLPVVEPPITDVWIGIDRVYELLKDFSLVIHDSCHGLMSEIGDYRRKLNRTGNPTESIENKDAYHCLDALRYLVAYLVHPAEQTQVVYAPQRIGANW
jgi:phage terminase large subunit